MDAARRPDPGIGGTLLLVIGVAGVAMSTTILFLLDRALAAIGGFCAEGGPYVVAQPCPEGTEAASMVGFFGLMLFAGIGFVGAVRIGAYRWLPILAWSAVFATSGWNDLEAAFAGRPEGEGVDWGPLFGGIVFMTIALLPVLVLVGGKLALDHYGLALGSVPAPASPAPATLPEPGQPMTPASADVPVTWVPVVPVERAPATGAAAGAAGTVPAPPVDVRAAFPEGTQALLDRLERLADMRDRGLLSPEEYETAKDLVMVELEGRS